MSQSYPQELRHDTSIIVIPVITILAIVACLALTFTSTSFVEVWYYWGSVIIAIIGSFISWRFIKQEETETLGAVIFLTTYTIIITLLMSQVWVSTSPLPYLYSILIVASSMFLAPRAGLTLWGISIVLSVGSIYYRVDEFSLVPVLIALLPSIVINFVVALTSFLSAMEWEYAVESVSDLHRNVQKRRDELFAIQEEVSMMNSRLVYTNDQLEVARKAAIAERDLRTRFMNHVSHELRTPLNAMVNFAHILAMGGRGEVTQEQKDYLGRIEKSGWHLLSVLNDLLDMAQIEAGEFNLHLEYAPLEPICEEAMTSARGLILEHDNVDLARDYPEEWPLVYVDKMRLKQALLNLLGNAVKYTEDGYITLRVKPDKEFVHLTVEDTGIGIPEDALEKIFQEFQQVDETAARKRIGTGLGLPITKHLIERHGGSVSVESTVGTGSAFTLTLPIAQENNDAHEDVVAVESVATQVVTD